MIAASIAALTSKGASIRRELLVTRLIISLLECPVFTNNSHKAGVGTIILAPLPCRSEIKKSIRSLGLSMAHGAFGTNRNVRAVASNATVSILQAYSSLILNFN